MNSRSLFAVSVLLATGAGASRAGDLDIRVLLMGQVAPGVYGQVQLGNAPPPPVLYTQPMLIEAQPAPLPPVYLHVPPGHAKHWRQHCQEYHACNRQVYFVRSSEYDREDDPQDRGHYKDKDHDKGHGHGHGHDGDDN